MKSIATHIVALFSLSIAVLPVTVTSARADDVVTNKSTWSGSASAGLTITRGNSRSLLGTITIDAADKWEHNELLLNASVTYGTTDTNTTSSAADANAQYNWLFTERVYGGLKLDAFHDDIAEIKYRLTVAPLAGYYFIKTTNTSLSGELGPAFIYENQGAGTNNDTHSYFTARLGERFEHKFSPGARVWQSLEFLPQVDNVENYLAKFELGIEAAVTKKVALRVVLQDLYDNEPPPEKLKNDLRLIAGVGYKF
jgi:putative salt-induced outer membrane protein YdiY